MNKLMIFMSDTKKLKVDYNDITENKMDIAVLVNITKPGEVTEIINDKSYFIKSSKKFLKDCLSHNCDYDDYEGEIINEKVLNYFLNNIDNEKVVHKYLGYFKMCAKKIMNFLDNFDNEKPIYDEIIICCEETNTIIDIIEKNPSISNKKIIISKYYDITNIDELYQIAYKFPDSLDNIYINLSGNSKEVTLRQTIKTVEKIEKEATKIRKYNLSLIENIMYAYDIVRNRVYKHEKECEPSTSSRDLTSILFGDNIVCAGYSKYFIALLKQLGIKSNYVLLRCLKKQNIGHARVSIYVKDSKYGIDGLYYFDPTHDSKDEKNKEYYLRNYHDFAITRDRLYDREKEKYEEENMPGYRPAFAYFFTEIANYADEEEYNKYVETAYSILRYTNNFENYKEPQNSKVLAEDLIDAIDKMNREIPDEVIIEVFKKVKEVESIEDPLLVPDLSKNYKLSRYKKIIYRHTDSEEERLLKMIFGDDIHTKKEDRKELNDIGIARIRKRLNHKED